MQLGLLYEAQRPFTGTSVDWNALHKETLEQCVLAEKVGFDNLWFVEHHFLTGFSGPEVLLGALRWIPTRCVTAASSSREIRRAASKGCRRMKTPGSIR